MSPPELVAILYILMMLAIISFPKYFRPIENKLIGTALFAFFGSGFGILPAIVLGFVGYQLEDKPKKKEETECHF